MQQSAPPHLLLKVFAPDKQHLVSLLSTGEVVLAYQGRWCSFQYNIVENTEDPAYLKLAIELANSFLHYGQFTRNQIVQLYHEGVRVATAQVEEVLGPCLHYWDNLPFNPAQRHLFPVQDEVAPVIANWVTTLSGIIRIAVDTTSTTEYRLLIEDAAHRTLLLAQARQICQTLKDSPLTCYYKITYTPPLYGLLDLFLQDFTLAFVLYNQTHFAKGVITVN